jgi:hypothetical protein
MGRRCLIALGLLALMPAAWAVDPCDELPEPSVTVKRLAEKPPELNVRYGYRSLTTLGASLARPGRQVLGLTRGSASVRLAVSSPSVVSADGRWECASPQLTLTYGFAPLTVYVAREFPPGSCAYREIHEHEMRHVRAYQAHLKAIEKTLADALQARFAGTGPWRGPRGETNARLQAELQERWVPFVKREINKVDAAQALIDTPEEYARVAASCGGEIRKLTR